MDIPLERLTIGAFAAAAQVNVETATTSAGDCWPSRTGPAAASDATGKPTWRA